MTLHGRPIRFLVLVLAAWFSLRVIVIWLETGSLSEAVHDAVPDPIAPLLSNRDPVPLPMLQPSAVATVAQAGSPLGPTAWRRGVRNDPPPYRAQSPRHALFSILARSEFGPVIETAHDQPAEVVQVGPTPQNALLSAVGRNRWSASSWFIARSGTGLSGSADAPQLGGTQAGVRLDYAIGRRFALTGRLAAPTRGIGREASLGIAYQPRGLPVRVVAEQRIALDGGRGGPSLALSGGGIIALPAKFDLTTYAQGGAIARGRIDHFIDGSARLARPIASAGGVRFDLGVGAWGGAQRGVARLDVGPSVSAVLPIADRAVRVSLDWRQRVAGLARPGSGPALSIGSDF